MTEQKEDYIPALRFSWLTKYYDSIIEFTTREKYFKHRLIQQAQLLDSHKVIDVGSGTGTLAIWIKQSYPDIKVNGLDGDPNILSIANKKAEDSGLEISFSQGMSYDMPFEDGQFDRCLSSLFFHHLTLDNKDKTFNEIYRILNISGEIHIADWGKPSNFLMRGLFYIVQIFDGFETTSDNVNGLLPQLMGKAGFQDVSVIEEISTMFGTMTLYKAIKQK